MITRMIVYLLRALRFNLRLGNLMYFTIVAGSLALGYGISIHARESMRDAAFRSFPPQESSDPSLLINFLLLFALFAAIGKILDNSARIRALADEHVPADPFSMIDMGAVFRFFGILLAGYIALRIFDSVFRLYPYQSFRLSVGVLIFLIVLFPALFLSLLQEASVMAAFHPRQLAKAVSEIGIVPYLIMIFVSGAVFTGIYYFQLYQVNHLMWRALNYSTPGSPLFFLPLYIFVFLLCYGYTFLIFLNYHFIAYYYPVAESNDDIDEAEQQAIAATLSLRGLASPETQNADAPPDFSLLADADISGMALDTQKALASALARADVLLASNRIDAGLALLTPFCDDKHDAAAFFPAYRRIYALAPQYALLQRLITAAAHGHQPSFELIRPELERIDPAELPAEQVFPLAQFAARQQHYPTVLAITRHFAKNHPTHPQLIDNYLLAARALAKTGHTDKAQQMLTQMLARFAAHPKAGQIRATLKLLQA